MIANFNSVYYCMQSLHMIQKVYCSLGGNKYFFIYYECLIQVKGDPSFWKAQGWPGLCISQTLSKQNILEQSNVFENFFWSRSNVERGIAE